MSSSLTDSMSSAPNGRRGHDSGETRRDHLLRQQFTEMEQFFAPFVHDDACLLEDVCRQFEKYTVVVFLCVPSMDDKYFEREVAKDGLLLCLRGFNAWDVIGKARTKYLGDKDFREGFHAPTSWPKDVARYLEAVVPAKLVPEITSVLEPLLTPIKLYALSWEEMHHIAIMLEKRLTFEPRFLYRYLQAAKIIHGEELDIVEVAHAKLDKKNDFQLTLASKLMWTLSFWMVGWKSAIQNATGYDYEFPRFCYEKFDKPLWHDAREANCYR